MGSIQSSRIQRFHRYGAHLIEYEVDVLSGSRFAARAPQSQCRVFTAQAPQALPTTTTQSQKFPKASSFLTRRRTYVGFFAKFLDSFFNNYT